MASWTNLLLSHNPFCDDVDFSLLSPLSGLASLFCSLAPAFVPRGIGGKNGSADHIFGIAIRVMKRTILQNPDR
jgi:hypothetical protein